MAATEVNADTAKRQEEMVKQQQIAIAISMKISKDIINTLEQVEKWYIREWLYICAIDNMSIEQISGLVQENPTIDRIKKVRMDFLRDKYANVPFQKKLEKLKQEVDIVCEESRQARNAIEDGLETALKKQAQAQEETIRAKDELNNVLKKQVEELRVQVAELNVNSKERENIIQEKSQRNRIDFKEKNYQLNSNEENRKKKGAGNIFAKIRQNSETRRFIEEFIKNDAMQSEQTDFLLECLEEGLSIKEIELFASPGLSVDVMKRLKKLQIN